METQGPWLVQTPSKDLAGSLPKLTSIANSKDIYDKLLQKKT